MSLREFWRLVRFGLVGGTSFAIHAGLYYVFSRFVFTDLPLLASYILAMAISSLQNYTSHRAWTFGDQRVAPGSMGRYVVVLLSSLVLNSFIFWTGVHVLGIYDLIVVVLANAIATLFTYLGHRFYTFHNNPKSIFGRIRR